MKKFLESYLENKKITIPVTIIVICLIVGGIVFGVTATSKTEPEPTTVTASKEVKDKQTKNEVKQNTEVKADKTESSDTKQTDEKKESTDKKSASTDKKDASKQDSTTNKNESASQQTQQPAKQEPPKQEPPAETYDAYNRPMSCSATFFTDYKGRPAWKEGSGLNTFVCYYKDGTLTKIYENTYDTRVSLYKIGGADCPSCGDETCFGNTGCLPIYSEVYQDEHGYHQDLLGWEDEYMCNTCRYIEKRPCNHPHDE